MMPYSTVQRNKSEEIEPWKHHYFHLGLGPSTYLFQVGIRSFPKLKFVLVHVVLGLGVRILIQEKSSFSDLHHFITHTYEDCLGGDAMIMHTLLH